MKEHWDERYAAEEYIYGTHPNAWFAEKLSGINKGKLLLPAEGEGRNAVFAASIGWDVSAFDQSEEGRKKALKLATENSVAINYTIADLTTFNCPDTSFDAIALIFVHMPVEIRQLVHQNLIKCLKPGGYLILEAFTKKQIQNSSGGPKTELLLYERDYLLHDFSELEIIDFDETTTVLNEGPLHQGEAFVLRLYARKPIINF